MQESFKRRLGASHFDWPLLIGAYLLALYGVLAITIANYNPTLGADRSMQQLIMDANNGRLQLLWVIVSIAAVAAMMVIPYEVIGRMWPVIYIGDALLLTLVLATSKINGVRGWFQFLDRTFQPSEVAKVALIITLSKALTRYPGNPIPNWGYFGYVVIHFGIPAMLIFLQPDIGTLLVFVFIFIVLMFTCGYRMRNLMILSALGVIGILVIGVYMSRKQDFRWLRLVAFVHPESDPTGSSYQIVNSMVTVGSGGLTGTGPWAQGTLTHLNYVPENHTDFIFTVVGETLGFAGALVLLALYAFVIVRMLLLSYYTDDPFGRLLIIGVMAMLLFHVFENVGMCIGVMPITGIPLPFISYGGTNLVANMAGIGLVLNVTRNKKQQRIELAGASGLAQEQGG